MVSVRTGIYIAEQRRNVSLQDPRTMPKEQDWPISVEMQPLAGLGDGKPRPTGNMCSL